MDSLFRHETWPKNFNAMFCSNTDRRSFFRVLEVRKRLYRTQSTVRQVFFSSITFVERLSSSYPLHEASMFQQHIEVWRNHGTKFLCLLIFFIYTIYTYRACLGRARTTRETTNPSSNYTSWAENYIMVEEWEYTPRHRFRNREYRIPNCMTFVVTVHRGNTKY